MDEKTRKILEQPFEALLLRQRTGPNGQTLTYVEVQAYIDRLNVAFDGEWSFEVTHREQFEDQVIVEVRLAAGGAIKTGLGGAMVTRRRDNGKLVSLADDFKRAESEALKRSCRLLGIGASLYAVDGETCIHPGDSRGDVRSASPPAPARAGDGPTSPPPPTRNRITARQLSAIWAISKRLGYEPRAFRSYTRQTYGVMPEFLTMSQASEIISTLATSAGDNGNGSSQHEGLAQREPGEDG